MLPRNMDGNRVPHIKHASIFVSHPPWLHYAAAFRLGFEVTALKWHSFRRSEIASGNEGATEGRMRLNGYHVNCVYQRWEQTPLSQETGQVVCELAQAVYRRVDASKRRAIRGEKCRGCGVSRTNYQGIACEIA